MRKIAVVTGTRAEYGYLKPLMKAIEKDTSLTLVPLVTGMHLLQGYGNTFKLVEKDFPKSVKIPMALSGDSLKDMALYMASGVKNFTEYFTANPPDILVVLGDRSESLAAALAALYLNIPIGHINGGDVTGTTIDESIRHALTKISHIHFVHTSANGERVRKMGEEKKRIFVTGALTLDTILHAKLKTKIEVFKKYGLDPKKPTFLVVQHPITTVKDSGYSQLKEIFLALDALKQQTIFIYPNCDAGGKQFIELINKNMKKEYIHGFQNIEHEDYLSLMKASDLMIGNSSGGIIEAPSFKLPVINIGSRQQGRNRSVNIIDVEPKKNNILSGVKYALHDNTFRTKVSRCKNRFGDGTAAQKIVHVLKQIKIDEQLIQKQITY
jgi:GDP/UDP-N,N'-diacetylbacillosamine 2-epimerase (hydrolysing)